MAIAPPPLSERLGPLYKIWVLDCIPNLAYAVSVDFSNRPELYKKFDDDTMPGKLTELQSEWGKNKDFSDDITRRMLMNGICGDSDSRSGNDGSIFQSSRMPVLAAAADFAGAEESTLPIHRKRFVSASRPWKTFMQDLDGASFEQTRIRMGAIFQAAESILKDKDIAAVFGVNTAIKPGDPWPLELIHPDGAKLIEQITNQLTNTAYGAISRHQFVAWQEIGIVGDESLRGILETDIESIAVLTDDTLDALIRQFYAWASDLGLVGAAPPQPTIARVQPYPAAISRTTRTA